MRLPVVLLAALLLLPAPPALARTEPVPPAMDEVGLAWRKAPRIYDMTRFYPIRAKGKGYRKGLAVVDCTAEADGDLACVVAREDPQDGLFGEAALKVMRPTSVIAVDGGSPEGRTFRFTFKFGVWPQSAMPAFMRLDQHGLAWVDTPPVGEYWSGTGLGKNGAFSVLLDCAANDEGKLTCTVADDSTADRNYVEAVLKAMSRAKVRTLDGSSPAGKTFTHRMTMSVD